MVGRIANCELTITNGEVRIMFESMVQGWFELWLDYQDETGYFKDYVYE
ncbi:MAG: hypothetical protein IJA10_03905 [Lachnospiraceae bacterium]|nr:hypothetical protein [Lachnospiraceae bacterium]